MEAWLNFPLLAALAAIACAQLIKVPLYYIPNKKWNWGLLLSPGGMPSSHSAAVTALSTAVAMEHGVQSTVFAICVIFGMIVMFDAAGVRRHAGEQAVVLNQLVNDFNRFVKEMKDWTIENEQGKRDKLKELLGHQPSEVFVGGVFGIVMALAIHEIYQLLLAFI